MSLEYQILAAFGLDLLLGDPRWLPHPVRGIGRLALALEAPIRRRIRPPRLAGVVTAALVVVLTGAAALLILRAAALWHPAAADAASVVLLYTAFASRDLLQHGHRVYRDLRAGDLPAARCSVSMLVGRDTEHLDAEEVSRAAIESVAENLVDGVTAPVFFAVLGGPAAALAYKAVSTLDSTFGYRDERYRLFGWASARLDDAANYLPARLTVPFIALAAGLLGLRPRAALQICRRDGRKHESPNAGLSEAAAAGALGVRLGGRNYYGGECCESPLMGDPLRRVGARDILMVNRLMLASALLFLFACVGARAALQGQW